MTKYWALFRIRLINSLQYRVAALAGLATQFTWGFMEITVFSAFYRVAAEAFPMTLAQTSSYIWLQQAFIFIFFINLNDNEIITGITEGAIAYEMVRPMDIYNRWFCQIAATRIAAASLRAVPVVIVAFLLPYPIGLSLPLNLFHFICFIITFVLALAVVVAFTNLIYVSLFYTMSIQGMQIMVYGFVLFLSGAIIPIPFFPDSVQRVVELLPFAAMSNLPLRIYSGHIAGAGLIQGMILQVFWLLFLLLLGRIMLRRALKRVVIQGG